MKTFKVITLQVVENDDLKDIEIVDGLIINKEDGKGNWLIEGCMRKEFYDFFRDAQQSAEDLEVQVVISNPENDPAAFMTRISCIKTMDLHLSVLFEGRLKKMRNEYAELLLDDLMEKGFEGSGLLQEFKDKMRSKPRLAATSKTTN
ncbi:MAG: YwpF family protein [Bacillota bacterium]